MKYTFAFENTHLHFETHICILKHTFAFENTHLHFETHRNKLPVKFVKDGVGHDMSIDFVLTMWMCYCAQMNGRPKPTVDSCQKVLYYLIQEVKLVVRSWRKRQQHYSSASIFKTVGTDLKHWVFGDPVSPTDEDAVRQRRKRVLKPIFVFQNPHLHLKYTFAF